MGTVKDFVAFILIGTCLLATLAACETSKHAEIMSMEDLRAQASKPAAPAADTGLPFEGKPRKSLGLSEPFDITPEPPPGPASPAPASKPAPPEPKPAPPEPKPAPPEPKPAPPEPKPAPPEPKPAPSAPEPIVEETVPAEEPVAEPKIAKPEPSDFVPEAPQPVPEPAPAPPVSEPKPAPPAPEPIVEETVPAEEPVAEPKIAKLEPSDFVPEPPEPAPAPAPPASEPKPESGLADVFFDFDQYTIRDDARPILEKDAELLKSTYKDSGVLIEGHCDERGTVEYNLELGKRRAQAVKDYLVDLGIEESRIQIVSYGKERPFCTESNESCFQQNRRGHFVRQ